METSKPSTPAGWTRRAFVRGAAGVLALPHLPGDSAGGQRSVHVAYVAGGPGGRDGSGPGEETDAGSISVLTANSRTWSLQQLVPSTAPAFLLHSPARQMLYVANDISVYEGTPRGTVEAFRIDPADGKLTLAGRTPLSLAATHPRHLALSPDGKWLAVAAYEGGIYNLLPVAIDGSLGAPRGIFKDVGCGPHAALQTSSHPHTLLFDDTGKHLLSTDFGLDRISVFRIDDGRLMRTAQRFSGSGRGPGTCVLHPAGWLYVSHHLGGAIACYRYHSTTGTIGEQVHEVAADRCLALHPSGRALYAADRLSGVVNVWQVDARTGRLTRPQQVPMRKAKPMQISVSGDGQRVSILDSIGGSMIQFQAHALTGELSTLVSAAAVHAPRGIVLHVL